MWVAWPEPSWVLLAKVPASAPEKLRKFRLSRDAEGLAAEEAAAAAVKEKEGSTAAAAEVAKAAILEKQQRLREGWQKAIQAVNALVKERLEQLELKGIRVECPPVAPAEVLAELHASLHSLDACYDEKYNLNSDLPKMPVIHKLLMDSNHTFESTYMLSLQDCDSEGGCEAGCSGWTGVP